MKKFLLNCLPYVLFILIGASSAELLLRRTPNPYRFKYEWMERNCGSVETLVLGSSHTFYGIKPSLLDGVAFNLANVSQDYSYDRYLLEYWKDRYSRLRTVIVPVSYFSWVDDDIVSGNESYRQRYYRLYMDCDLYPGSFLSGLEVSNVASAKEKFRQVLMGDKDAGCDEDGWGTMFAPAVSPADELDDSLAVRSVVSHSTFSDWYMVDKNFREMKAIAEFCNEHEIQLILVTTPCWHLYCDFLDKRQLKNMHELIDSIVSGYGALYLNYMNDPRFQPSDFHDNNHLSETGAIKFTQLLNNDLSQIRK